MKSEGKKWRNNNALFPRRCRAFVKEDVLESPVSSVFHSHRNPYPSVRGAEHEASAQNNHGCNDESHSPCLLPFSLPEKQKPDSLFDKAKVIRFL
jgi:hypothetical protein